MQRAGAKHSHWALQQLRRGEHTVKRQARNAPTEPCSNSVRKSIPQNGQAWELILENIAIQRENFVIETYVFLFYNNLQPAAAENLEDIFLPRSKAAENIRWR